MCCTLLVTVWRYGEPPKPTLVALYLRVVSLDLHVGGMVWQISFTACACIHFSADVTKRCFVRLGCFPAAMHAVGSSSSQSMAATVTCCNPQHWFSQCNSHSRYSRPLQAKSRTDPKEDVLIVIYSKFEAISLRFARVIEKSC